LFTDLRPAQDFLPLYGDVTIIGEGQQKCRPIFGAQGLEQGGILIVPHLL
jgi:hypothetical protein